MENVNRYLKQADEAIIKAKIAQSINKDGVIGTSYVVPSAYKGAISSFGASLVMSGLVPTIQFYMADSDNRESDHRSIIEAIAQIIYGSDSNAEHLKSQVMLRINNKADLNALRRKIADAAIALKIMLRTYHFEKETDKSTD